MGLSKQGCDPAQRDTVAPIQTRPLPSDHITCAFILFAPDGPEQSHSPSPFPLHNPITIQGKTSVSLATQSLTRLHSTLGLSMGGPSNPHRSSLFPTSLRMIVDPIPALPITLALPSLRSQSRLSWSLVSRSPKPLQCPLW